MFLTLDKSVDDRASHKHDFGELIRGENHESANEELESENEEVNLNGDPPPSFLQQSISRKKQSLNIIFSFKNCHWNSRISP